MDIITINGERIHQREQEYYFSYHKKRTGLTLDALHRMGKGKVAEMGGYPWVMTASLIDDPNFEVCATISAQEVTKWPDDIGVSSQKFTVKTTLGNQAEFTNYSANLERTLFDIEEKPDIVIACEIIEHVARAPHVLLLNANHWLGKGGKLLVTTPNGAHFNNPFRSKSVRPAYACYLYARHNGLFNLPQLIDMTELCGFRIIEAGYWDAYDTKGGQAVYSLLGSIPLPFMKVKFRSTIYVIGEKVKHVEELERTPRAYVPDNDWEYIAKSPS